MPAHLLVVDDEPGLAGLVQALLPPEYHVSAAGSLAAARAALGADAPDVVLLDLVLPDGNGLDLLGDIATLDAGAPVVVAMSGRRSDAIEDALARGARDFLAKPFSALELVARVAAAARAHADRISARDAQTRLALLADAASLLPSSLDRTATLARVARLAIPSFADWCSVYLLEEDGTYRGAAAAHVDPELEALLRELQRRYPPTPDGPQLQSRVLRTGRPVLYPHVSEQLARETSVDPENFELRRRLGLASVVAVPLRARDRLLGAAAFVRGPAGRPYSGEDLITAEALAARCALALDNARLYEDAQRELAERERAEEALRCSERRFRAMIEHALDVVTIVDQSGVILYESPSVERVLGYGPEELLGRRAFDFVHPDDLPRLLPRFEEVVVMPGRGGTARFRFRHRDGSWRHLEAVGRMAPPGAGIEGVIVNSRDVTDQTRAEEVRAELAAALAQSRERERIAMELHDGAIQALYAVALQLGAAARRPGDSGVGQRATIDAAVAEINRVIADVRAYVHDLHAGRERGSSLRADLADLVRRMDLSGRARVRLELAADPAVLDGALGPEAIHHVLGIAQEATSNALRHAAARLITIRPRWSRRRFVLQVRDDGRGFEPPSHAAPTGRGLANMAERARQLGGQLIVRSRPGAGTEIRLEVPLHAPR